MTTANDYKDRYLFRAQFETFESRLALSGHHLAGALDLPDDGSLPAEIAPFDHRTSLLQETDFNYLGAFRVPGGTFGGSRFEYGGTTLAFNPNDPNDPEDDTLFIDGHVYHRQVAEISIPNPVDSDNLGDLQKANVLQNFADPADGHGSERLGGLLVDGNKLLWTSYEFYDANRDATLAMGYSPSLDLSIANDAKGMFRVGEKNPGYLAGYMTHIPQQWQEDFGGPILAGQSNLNIITRTSAGPAAFVIDPADLGVTDPAPATPLVYYDVDTALGGGMDTTNGLFNYNSRIGGMIFPEGTASVLFFGRHGKGEVCYGTAEDCNDPTGGGKGWHDVGGNYVNQVWAYDANDLLDVKNGAKQPWEAQPYATWEIDLPFASGKHQLGGIAYDAATNRVFVAQYQSDTAGTYEWRPLVHVYEVQAPDHNPGSPRIDNQAFGVAENSVNGSAVGTVVATDPDGDTLSYSITAGNSNGAFAIDSGSGVISVADSNLLNHEAASQIGLTVKVDAAGLSDTATVTVNINDVNEFAPVAQDATFNVLEGVANGTAIGTVSASDADTSQTLTYAIASGNTNNVFSINSATGQILVADNTQLDHDDTPQFVLTVDVTDNLAPTRSDSGTIRVNVDETNQAPVLAAISDRTMPNTANTLVVPLSATDPNGDTLTYSAELVSVVDSRRDPMAELAYKLDQDLNLTFTGNYSENWGGMGEKWMKGDDAWYFITADGSFYRYHGEMASSTKLATLDENFHADPTKLHDAPVVNEGSGGGTSEQLAYELDQQHGLTFTGSYVENWGGMGEKWMKGDDAWYFITEDGSFYRYHGEMADSTKLATLDETFHADPTKLHDAPEPPPSSGAEINLTVVGNQLTIDPPSGFLGEIQVRATASDSEFTDSETFTVNVEPDQAPVIDNQTFGVAENSVNGSAVGTVVATDPDGDTLSYSITAGNSNGAFAIDSGSGVISVADSNLLNHEAASQIGLTVKVDAAGLSDTATVTVNINDVNEFTPVAQDATFNVLEGIANGTAIGTVSASDADTSQTLTYAIASGNTNNVFSINSATGQILVADNTQLDHDNTPQYVLTVDVTDNLAPTRSDSGTIRVNVDETNQAPVLAAIGDRTMPNTANTLVVPLSATDPNGDTLTYSAELVSVIDSRRDPMAELAYKLDQDLNLTFTGNYSENWGGMGEKWMKGDDAWYFITADGSFYRYHGEMASSTKLATLDENFHADPTKLHDAPVVNEGSGGGTSEQLAYELDQQHGLTFTGSYVENWGGMGEKWMKGDDAWYFITEDGSFFRYQGEMANSTKLATLDETFHADPTKLHDAPEPPPSSAAEITLTVVGNQLTIDPPSGFLGEIQVKATASDSELTDSETFTVTVTETAPQMNLSDVSMSDEVDATTVGNDFSGSANSTMSGSADQLAALALQLDQQLGLYSTGAYFENWGGLNERWMQSATKNWHFITPQGQFYRWDGQSDLGTSSLIANLGGSYHSNPATLHDAAPEEGAVAQTRDEAVDQVFKDEGADLWIEAAKTESESIASDLADLSAADSVEAVDVAFDSFEGNEATIQLLAESHDRRKQDAAEIEQVAPSTQALSQDW